MQVNGKDLKLTDVVRLGGTPMAWMDAMVIGIDEVWITFFRPYVTTHQDTVSEADGHVGPLLGFEQFWGQIHRSYELIERGRLYDRARKV
jgi:hypothetical protein